MQDNITNHERLEVIKFLCEINISCENNLKDIIEHISFLQQNSFDEEDIKNAFNAGKRSLDNADEYFDKINKW